MLFLLIYFIVIVRTSADQGEVPIDTPEQVCLLERYALEVPIAWEVRTSIAISRVVRSPGV